MLMKNFSRVPLSPVDNAWLRMEVPSNLMMITGVFMFQQPLQLAHLRSLISNRLLVFRRFRQRVIKPRFSWLPSFWEDDPTFDLSSHLHRIALPNPGDQVTLQELINDLMSTPLDYTKPLWQIHLVENYGDGCAVVCRLHHCIGDGIALMKVLLSLTDDADGEADSTAQAEESWDDLHRDGARPSQSFSAFMTRTRNVTQSFIEKGLDMLADPEKLTAGVKLSAESSAALAHLLLLSPDPQTSYKGTLGVAKRCAWSQPFSLADVKAIGRTTGGTVNDVLLTAVTGALGRYLRSRGEAIGGLNFRAVVPVNLRPPDEELKLGNAFGLVFLSLPVGIDDPLDRLNELKDRMDEIKGTPEAIVAYGILNAIGLGSIDFEEVVVNLFEKKATTVMTNVPGPKETRYFAGQPIKGMMFWVPQSGRLGLGVSIFSYAGEVLVGIATDAGLTPDPENIICYLHQEFDALMALVRMVEQNDQNPVQGEAATQSCQAISTRGTKCKNKAKKGSIYCQLHRDYTPVN